MLKIPQRLRTYSIQFGERRLHATELVAAHNMCSCCSEYDSVTPFETGTSTAVKRRKGSIMFESNVLYEEKNRLQKPNVKSSKILKNKCKLLYYNSPALHVLRLSPRGSCICITSGQAGCQRPATMSILIRADRSNFFHFAAKPA